MGTRTKANWTSNNSLHVFLWHNLFWHPSFTGQRVQKQIVLDGLAGSGKSIILAMLVHWARDDGWLVFYVPRARDWTHKGFRYKNPITGLWDTPCKATTILQARH